MPSSTPGRNDPCPCGSGRKFKQCCLDAWTKEDSARNRLLALESAVVNAVIPWLDELWGPELVAAAWEEFFLDDSAPADMEGTPEFIPMFLPWLALEYDPGKRGEEHQDDWPVGPIAVAWANSEDADVDDEEDAFLEVAVRSPMSAFLIEAVTPGRGVDVLDLLTGKRFHALEQETESLEPNELMFARVATMDGASILFGVSPWMIPGDYQASVAELRQDLVEDRPMTRAELQACAADIRQLYLDVTAEMLEDETATIDEDEAASNTEEINPKEPPGH